MTFPELDKKFDNIVRDLATARGQMMVDLGERALKMIKDRVMKTGTDAKGAKYRPYSTKAMLSGCSGMAEKKCNTIVGSKEKRKQLEWRTIGSGDSARRLFILPGGYRQWRQIYGAQVDHVDFSLSNDMWNNINIRSNYSQHEQGIVILGAERDKEKKKLAYHTKDRGDILDLNPTEIMELYKKCELTSLQIIRDNGL